jgi:hypothetical protein
MTGTPTRDPDTSGGVGTVDSSHLLLVGAGPGLGMPSPAVSLSEITESHWSPGTKEPKCPSKTRSTFERPTR